MHCSTDEFIKKQRKAGNVLYENKEISLDNLPHAGLQLPGEGDVRDPMNTIYENNANVNTQSSTTKIVKNNIGQLETEIKNIDTQINELKKNGSNDAKIAELEAQKATAEQNLDAAKWDKAATDAYNYTTKTYDNAADMIKGENPSPEEFVKESKHIRKEEVPQVRQTAVKLVKLNDPPKIVHCSTIQEI